MAFKRVSSKTGKSIATEGDSVAVKPEGWPRVNEGATARGLWVVVGTVQLLGC